MLAGGKHLSWITDGYPANKDDGSRREACLEVHHSIDTHLRTRPDVRALEHGAAGGQEDLLVDCAADNMCVGTDKTVGGDAQAMDGGATENSVLHDDALAADLDGACAIT